MKTKAKYWISRGVGFTLIEMLAVLAIIAIVAGVAAPAVLGLINSTRLAQAGEDVAGLFSQAQQIASSESRPVEVRLYNMRDNTMSADDAAPFYRGVLLVKYYQSGEADPRAADGAPLGSPIGVADFGGIYRLPSGVLISPANTLSSMMTLPERSGSGGGSDSQLFVRRGLNFEPYDLPEGVGYRAFLFLPETTNLSASGNWFVTLIQANDLRSDANSIRNFFTIQVEPVTGRLMTYRP
jgi:prepilin-type N-terminal cleavage/methylation domain-containing protein